MLPQPSAVLALQTVVSENALHPSLRHCDVMVRHPKLLFHGNRQMPDLRCVLHGPGLTDVCLVLNWLYKAAPTACATFEEDWGGGQTAMTSQTNANTS